MAASEIFDRHVRRLRRDRAAPLISAHDFLRAHMVEDLLDRLDGVNRKFERALDLDTGDGALAAALRARGISVIAADPGARFATAQGGVQADEDRLPFADGSFDLILCAGGLESVNDLPGALALIRRALRPDGLFLGSFIGAGSLSTLKAVSIAADIAGDQAVQARVHPQIEVRTAGDLLARAGFALPVADSHRLSVRYSSLFSLFADLRGMGATNVLAGPRPPLTRHWLSNAVVAFAERAEADGKTTEHFEIVVLTGWSPGPNQPKPARRGSATASLAEALRKKP